ncbi:hypothetical protein I7I50_08285 [Histoplasma capsulatum G186AR]|uniref:Uncharacterized protein n=1 Tax=Ajellomyces capsulatus TaxID=5037 RepID=A0A8H7YTN6_AJECA|nr:hypothetical protein I7I52_05801 [Histoplasma capsulatum]QSS73496.1 hypothetical protein I7I50_08285 [Histoplasma capsulatum G186AR]
MFLFARVRDWRVGQSQHRTRKFLFHQLHWQSFIVPMFQLFCFIYFAPLLTLDKRIKYEYSSRLVFCTPVAAFQPQKGQ